DAFTSTVFSGNPAAVCPLSAWLPDNLMQSIAAENNLSETAFFVGQHGEYNLRWFTPSAEVALCGHATLASAFVIFSELDDQSDQLVFQTKSGKLIVQRYKQQLMMDFPAQPAEACEAPDKLIAGLGKTPQLILAAEDYLAVYESQRDVEELEPNFNLLRELPLRGVIASAPGVAVDFVSRCFYPNVGVNEDPVTGSAHCTLTPYWSERLKKTELEAHQVSARGGHLQCRLHGERVLLIGQAVKYLEGKIIY
ncbi:PhzF family phenazine biosynthesis protein, partial [Oligoflexia bacterium]|nr:PhzF family phenazine biosynthesis protein [Oligoflexia bacterium]